MPFWSLQRCCDQSRFHVSLLQRSLLARRTEGGTVSFDAETPRPEAPRERLDSLTGIISVFLRGGLGAGHLECAPWGFDHVAGRRARSPGENPLSHS